MIKRFLMAFLCMCLLPVGILAADVSDYTVESVPDKTLDPDVIALYHFDGNSSNAVSSSSDYIRNFRFFNFSSSSNGLPGFGKCTYLYGTESNGPTMYFSSSPSSTSSLGSFSLEFLLDLSTLESDGTFIVRLRDNLSTAVQDFDILRLNPDSSSFLNSSEYISSSALISAFFTDSYVSVKIVYIDKIVYLFVDGFLLGYGDYTGPSLYSVGFYSTRGRSYIDELRFSTGKYVSDLSDYAPATEPFPVPYIPVLPELPVDDCVYFVSPLPAGELIFNSTVPADAAAGDLWLQLDTNNVCSSAQVYDGASWTDAIAGICVDGFARDVIGYKFETGSPDVPVDPDAPRDFLSTSFTTYTVTEGFLLALLLCVVAAAILKLIKEGFYWLW